MSQKLRKLEEWLDKKTERDLIASTGEYDLQCKTGTFVGTENESWFNIPFEEFNALPNKRHCWNNMKFYRKNKKEMKKNGRASKKVNSGS